MHPFCTWHPRLPVELARLPGHSPRLPDAPCTPHITSYHSHPFFLGHLHLSLTHSISLLAVVSWKNSLFVTRQSIALESGGLLYFQYSRKNEEKNRPREGASTLPCRGCGECPSSLVSRDTQRFDECVVMYCLPVDMGPFSEKRRILSRLFGPQLAQPAIF